MRNLSIHQTVIAVAGLAGITVLAALGKVSGDVVSVIYASVITGALGYVNGKKAGALMVEDNVHRVVNAMQSNQAVESAEINVEKADIQIKEV